MVKNLPTVERSTKIRFGKNAVEDQAENTIVFNASNTELQATQSGAVYLSPIRFREDFSDPEIVLLMYDKSTGEITESGSSASTAVEPPLQSVTSFGNTTTHTLEFNNPKTAFTTVGNVHISGDLEILGNVQFSNGSITEIKTTDLVVEDRIIGIARNNNQAGLDIGMIMNYPEKNVAIIHHGDETPKRLSIGYTLNTHTDTSILPDSNVLTLDVLGDIKAQNNVYATKGTFTGAVSGTTGTFSGAVSGTTGTFSGAVSGTSVTDGTGTLTGGEWSGSTATLTTPRAIGGVDFDGSAAIVLPGVNAVGNQNTTGSAATLTTPRAIGGVDFDGSAAIVLPGVNAVGNQNTTGSAATLTTPRAIGGVDFDGSAAIVLPSVNAVGNQNTTGSAATLTTPRAIGGVNFDGSTDIIPTTFDAATFSGDISVNTNAIKVDSSNKKVGIGKTTPGANLDVVGNVYASGDITTDAGIVGATGTFSGSVSGTTGVFSSHVSGVNGAFTGAVSGTSGTFSSTLSSAGFTATNGQFNGTLASTNDFTVGVDKLVVDVSTSSVGIGVDSPAFNLDVNGSANVGVLTTTKAATFGATKTLVFTVSNASGANKFYINDVQQHSITLHENQTYIFDLSSSTLVGHPFMIQDTIANDGNASGTPYSAGITTTGTYGSSEKRTFVVPVGAPTTLYYYCTQHSGMGSTITIATIPEVIVSGNLDTATATLSGDLSVGVDKLFVDVSASGVGIGTTAPAFNLDVHGTANVGTFTATTANLGGLTTTTGTLTNDLIVGVNKLVVDVSASGVGIGTVAPAFNLDVHGTANVGTFTTTTATVTADVASTSVTTGSVKVTGGIGLTGNVYASGNVYAQSEQDGLSHLGRAKIGFDGNNTDHAAYSHEDYMSSTAYALKQTATSGVTHINTPTGGHVRFNINNNEVGRFTSAGDFLVDTDTLYVDASQHCVGIETTTPHANLHVSGNVYVSNEITTATNVNAAKVYSSEGMVINTGSVCKKFYSYKGTIPNAVSASDAAIKLTFSTNIFYAKIVAHLIEADNEFSNMSLEVGGGHRDGDNSPTQLAIATGSISVFGNTSTNPWDTQVATTTTTVTLKPSATTSTTDSNSGNVDYNVFIEYISPDSATGKLASIHGYSGSSADQELVTFNY